MSLGWLIWCRHGSTALEFGVRLSGHTGLPKRRRNLRVFMVGPPMDYGLLPSLPGVGAYLKVGFNFGCNFC